MKAQERHQLKQNEFAEAAARLAEAARRNSRRLVVGLIAGAVLVAAVGGVFYWRSRTNNQAGARLAVALATAEAQIAPAPSVPGAAQAAGTYPTIEARSRAALQAFEEVARDYPSTPAGIAARYHAAGHMLALGQAVEAEARFRELAGDSDAGLYATMSRMGIAEALLAQNKYDEAIGILTELAAEREAAVPVDGVLMQLGRAQSRAGRPAEARAAFQRVLDEFPDSVYRADAQQELASLG
jgi:TolA-binding protein